MRARAEDTRRPVRKSGLALELGPESAAVAAALGAWRENAANTMFIASAAVYFPVLALGLLGYGPRLVSLVQLLGLAACVTMAACAVLRRIDYRTRLGVFLGAAYLIVALTNVFVPGGPLAQVGLVACPVIALVLCGSRARVATVLASVVILVSARVLHTLPAPAGALGLNAAPAPAGLTLFWVQAVVLAGLLAWIMILLGRFHRFLLETLTAQVLTTSNLKREMRDRQHLQREVAAIGDEERRRLGQELHDGVCQQVTAALLRCQGMENRLKRGANLSSEDFAPLSSLLAETIDDARHVARGLCPLEPDPEALVPAVRALTRRTQEMAGLRCDFHAAGDVRVPDPAMAQHLYRIAQEALSNAARHAHARRIAVELHGSDRELTLKVQDDGAGFLPGVPAGGMGLRNMAYRAQILGGELTVGPAPGGGALVTCRVPREAPGPEGAPPGSPPPESQSRWIPAT